MHACEYHITIPAHAAGRGRTCIIRTLHGSSDASKWPLGLDGAWIVEPDAAAAPALRRTRSYAALSDSVHVR